MYFPYMRGKQYELVTIREKAALLSQSSFIPIIEPVKQSVNGLFRALNELKGNGGECILIANPGHGDFADDTTGLHELISDFTDYDGLFVGILLATNMTVDNALDQCKNYSHFKIALVHVGFTEGSSLAARIAEQTTVEKHVFLEDCCGKLYRRNFKNGHRVLLRDGFNKQKNREYPELEFFSDLHITYDEENMDGFGDFLIVGDEYFDTGGPAYAVAIHLTFIDPEKDDGMYIYHFISDRTDTPKDPAGKFAEALEKLVAEVKRPGTPVLRTSAVKEFIELHKRQHFPGLGYIKKLSMIHHIETLTHFFQKDQ